MHYLKPLSLALLVLVLTTCLWALAAGAPSSGISMAQWVDRSGSFAFNQRVGNLANGHNSQYPGPLVYDLWRLPVQPVVRPLLHFDLGAGFLLESGQESRQFNELMTWRPQGLDTIKGRWRVLAGFRVDLPQGFFLQQQTIVDSDPGNDPTARTKEFRQVDASVEVPVAVVGYHRKNITAWLGRRWETWGPGFTGSLVLDAHCPTDDGLGADWTTDRWSARYRMGRLDDIGSNGNTWARYMAGHRVDVAITRTLRVGLSETALVATTGPFPLWLANPLLPWALTQQEDRGSGEKTNILWALDAAWNPSRAWALYGQFLLDDAMVDLEDRDTYPDQLGVLAGAIWTPGSQHSWQAGLEYTRIWSWTYVHRDSVARYEAWSAPLGHPQGPDSESVTAFVRTGFAGPVSEAMIWSRWNRHGQVWLGTSESPVGGSGQPFPTAPVSTWWQLGGQVQATPVWRLEVNLSGGWTNFSQDIDPDSMSPPPGNNPALGWWGSLRLSLPLVGVNTGL